MQIAPPRNAVLQSAQGLVIDVGYTIDLQDNLSYQTYFAAMVNFSVSGTARIVPTSKVTVVLINRWVQTGIIMTQQVWISDLVLAESYESLVAFTGTLDNNVTAKAINPGGLITIGQPQIAVVVDGVWQQDPLQWPGAHNFNFAWLLD